MRQVWTYKARDPNGRSITGEIEADTRAQVLQVVGERGLIPIRVKERPEKMDLSSVISNFGSANMEKLIIFTKKLRTLYRSGTPLLRALTIMERGADEMGLKEEIQGIKNDLHGGLSLSQALGRYPKKFPPIYVSSIAAGEASGSLDEVLDQLAILVEKEMTLLRQLKSALTYPTAVVCAICLAVFILMSFVIPVFADTYRKFGAELPLPTKIMMSVSSVFSSYWYLMLGAIGGALIWFKKFVSSEKGRLKWDHFILKLPVLGDLIVKANIARFASMLKILFRSGIPMISCLTILKETSSNKVISGEIGQMLKSFERGQEIGAGVEHYEFMPSMAIEMLEVGLETGSIEIIMGELASHYEAELEYKYRHLTSLLLPIMTVILAGLVLVLALSVFLPIWNLMQVIR